jgi:diguanylate cyclase (GGDEF)-like protein
MVVTTAVSASVGLGAFALGFALAWLRKSGDKSPPPSTLALESIARTLAADVRDHAGSVRSAESALTHGSDESVRDCVRRILEAGTRLQARLQDAEDRLARQAVALEQSARASQIDALTQAFNRGALDERLSLAFQGQQERGRASALLMLDVDHFKRVNDRFGHPAGDVVLKTVAKRIQGAAPSGSFVARYGGEEFAVLFEGSTAEECRQASEAIRAAIGSGDVIAGERTIKISSSAGLGDTSGAASLETWIERSDSALYFAKNAGRDRGFLRVGDEFREFVTAPVLSDAGAASQDKITGLLTRDAFASAIDQAIAEDQRGAIVVARLDGYSELIERRGFRAAEGALKSIAAALRSSVREKDPAGRIGRSTFAVLLPDAAPVHAQRSIDRLQATFASTVSPDDGLALTTAQSELAKDSDGKTQVAKCIATMASGWFPTAP